MQPLNRDVEIVLLVAILLAACATRFLALDTAPPVINPDEASNGYDAYCILETGQDRWGESWPVLLKAYGNGDYRPALAAYLTVPFLAVLGPERFVWATRLPAAVCGVLTIACLYALVRRVCDARTALWAALLLTCSPWHFYVSRFGHESALTPGMVVFALYALSLAGWPLRGRSRKTGPLRLRWPWLVVFGVIVSLSPYAYASMKLFMPAFLLGGALIYWRVWREVAARRQNVLAVLAGLAAAIVVIAPMVWLTITEWDKINSRGFKESIFHQGFPTGETLARVAQAYYHHFGLDWLFVHGHKTVPFSIPGVGQLNWYMLPLLPIGLGAIIWQWRRNRVYALLVAWLLLHPLASVVCTNSPHSLRAACGIPVFPWIGAVGISFLASIFSQGNWRRHAINIILCVFVSLNARWAIHIYRRNFVRHPLVYHLLQTDLRDAVLVLRDRWKDYDQIFISDHVDEVQEWPNFQPYIYVLMFLPVEPEQFHAWEKDVVYTNSWDPFHVVRRMGPFTLSTQPQILDDYFRTHPGRRVLIVARPGDIQGGRVVHEIRDPWGELRFEIIEVAPP